MSNHETCIVAVAHFVVKPRQNHTPAQFIPGVKYPRINYTPWVYSFVGQIILPLAYIIPAPKIASYML